MMPELDVVGSSLSFVPANIKVKKVVHLRPLPLELGGTLIWNLESHACKYKVSCKDTLINGKISLDVAEKMVEYRKRISLPVAGLRLGCFIIGARWTYLSDSHTVKPSYHVGFELKQGTEIVKLNTVRVKPRLFFKHIGIEAVTEISFQMPKQLIFDFAGTDQRREREPADGDAWGVKLDIQEMNLVLRL